MLRLSTNLTWVFPLSPLQIHPSLFNYPLQTPEPNTETPPESGSSERELPGIDFVSSASICLWVTPPILSIIYTRHFQTVIASHEEGSSLQEIARAVVSTQEDRIYLRVRQCDIPTLILVRLCFAFN